VDPTVYRVVLEGDRWRVAQGDSVIGPFVSKDDAISFARKFAQADPPSRVVVTNPDGTIHEEAYR